MPAIRNQRYFKNTRDTCAEEFALNAAVVSRGGLPVGGATEEHFHTTSEEIYYVLSGTGEMLVEGETFQVREGDAVALLPGEKHKIWNRGITDLVFLCICVPAYEHDDTVITE